MTRRLPILIAALLAVIAAIALTGSSSATFVARTSATTGTVTAATDWTPPTVAVTSPGSTVRGTVTIAATATDASGIANVTIQRAAAGSSSWTTLCTDAASPFGCSWTTTAVADGDYDLRATAVDNAGYTATSALVRVTVGNVPVVALTLPGDYLRGTVTATTTVTNTGGATPRVSVQYTMPGSTTWDTLCTTSTSPYTCTVDSSIAPNGTYDLRSVAVINNVTYYSNLINDVIVDNLAPSSVTMTDPGTLRGTKTFTAQAADQHSGIAKVVFQAQVANNSNAAWKDLCSDTSSPYSCSYDSKGLANGNYTFRAFATDNAGNTKASATFVRSVSNTAAAATVAAPTSSTVTATPESDSGAKAPADDDTTPPTGVDIQTTNGGTSGRIDAGDTIVYTFSEQMDLSSIYSGWSGTATSGTVRVSGFFTNVLEINSPSNIHLGSVDLNANFAWLVSESSDVSITASTEDGRTVVTVRVLNGTGYPVTTAANMVWTPSAAALDLAGNPMSTAAVTESGPKDVDF